MKEFDLDHIWKEADADADQYYQQIAPELEEKAKKQSRNILQRVHRTIWFEFIASLFAGGFFFLAFSLPVWFILLLGSLILSTLGFLAYYLVTIRRLLKDIQLRPSLEVIEIHLEVLNSFIRQMKLFYAVGIPFGFFTGLLIPSFLDGELVMSMDKALALGGTAIIGIPILYLLVKLTNEKYVYYLYTRKRDELQEVYDQLKDN